VDIKEEVVEAVFRALDEVNQMRPQDNKITKSLDTVLLGSSGVLDSLGLVNFIVEAEQQVEDKFGVAVNLADQRELGPDQNPIQSIGELVDYIASLVTVEHEP